MNSRFESSPLRPVWWDESAQALGMIDQTKLPTETVHLACRSLNEVWTAIKTLQVRGAPAIGVAAAYGVIVSMDESLSMNSTLPANSRYHNWPAAL